jgi:hypothetical protein
MLLFAPKFQGWRRRLAVLAVTLSFVAGGVAYWLRAPTIVTGESRLLADASRCYSTNRDMAISLNSYIPSDDRPLTPAQRKQIEAIDKLAKTVFRADAVLPTLSAAIAAAGPTLSSDPALQAVLERVARLKSEFEATASKDDHAASLVAKLRSGSEATDSKDDDATSLQRRHPVQKVASDRVELADIFIEPECSAVNTAAVMTIGDVVKTVLHDGLRQISKLSDADLRKGLSAVSDQHDRDYAVFAEGTRGAAEFWYAALLNALSPEEIAALMRYRATSQAKRAALVSAYREAVKSATAGLLFDYLRGDAAASP